MDSLWTTRNLKSLDESCYEAIDSSISQKKIFHISKCLAYNAEKTLQLKITKKKKKKRMNIANFINIYANIYTYIICDKTDSK